MSVVIVRVACKWSPTFGKEAAVRVQQVPAPDGGPESWTVLDDSFAVVDPVVDFLAHLTAIERSPGTVRSYAFDLRDYFDFLCGHGIDWRTVRLEHLGRFVSWLRQAPKVRSAEVTSLAVDQPHCSPATINRKLSAVGSFYKFHHRHGVDCGELLATVKPGGSSASWRPFLAHLGSDGDKPQDDQVEDAPAGPENLKSGIGGCGGWCV
jgi:integrase/recombinase XerD